MDRSPYAGDEVGLDHCNVLLLPQAVCTMDAVSVSQDVDADPPDKKRCHDEMSGSRLRIDESERMVRSWVRGRKPRGCLVKVCVKVSAVLLYAQRGGRGMHSTFGTGGAKTRGRLPGR